MCVFEVLPPKDGKRVKIQGVEENIQVVLNGTNCRNDPLASGLKIISTSSSRSNEYSTRNLSILRR